MRKPKEKTKQIMTTAMNRTNKWVSISYLKRKADSDYYTVKEILDELIKEGIILSMETSNGEVFMLKSKIDELKINYQNKKVELSDVMP